MEKKDIGYAWNIAADLGTGRQISISGNFSICTSAEEMNKEVDKIISVVNRQQSKASAIGAAQEIEQCVLRHKSAAEDLARIKEKSGQSAADRQQREAATVHVDKLGKDIEYKKGVLAQLLEEAK